MKAVPFVLILALLLHVFFATAQDSPIRAGATLPGHPRILLGKGEEVAIRQTIASDKVWAQVHRAMLNECDKFLTMPPVERIQIGRRLLDKSREALRRVFFLAYAWRITQQKPYLQRAEQELLAVSAFSDWNPSHFLDVAEMTMGVAIGYDWLYNDLSESSRATIREAILKKGIEPSLDPKNNGWLTASHNWNQVCNAGITYGALAIYEDQPERARQLMNRAIATVVLPMADYAPDGAYPEGYSYWGYGTTFNVMLISALEKAFGSDFGLAQQPGFLKTAGYLENMTGPLGNAFNYSDAGSGGELQPAMFWFATKQHDPSLLWVERNRLLSTDAGKHIRDRLLPAIMLWNGGIPVNTIPAPAATRWVGEGKSPVALLRTSWTDPAGIFVGLKAGSPGVNHAHMDVGSFVLEADGVRWAMDFGMQDYNSLESKGVNLWDKDQQSQRWDVFRYGNQAHNTLTVNDGRQQVAGRAVITSSSAAPAFLNATTDLTELYAGALAQAKRGIAIVDQAYVTVRDELATGPAEATVRWTLLTPAEVTLTAGNRAELRKDGKKLILQVQEPAGIRLKTWLTTPPHDYDAPNPGTTLVGFEVTMPANAKGAFTVLLLPEKVAGKPTKPVRPLANWSR